MLQAIVLDALITGLPLIPLILGVHLVFQIRHDFDLTVEGGFALGAAITAVCLTSGANPFLSALAAAVAGAAAGLLTAGLHIVLGIPVVLAGLVMSIGLFSVTLHVLGSPTVSLIDAETIFANVAPPGVGMDTVQICVLAIIVSFVLGMFAFFLRTELGLALRASGVNSVMVRSLGASERSMVVLSLGLANALAGFSGALVVQTQGFADVNMGIGIFVASVGAVLLGMMITQPTGSQVVRIVAGVLAGGLVYRLVLVTALRIGLPAADLKGVTALTLIVAVVAQRCLSRFDVLLRTRSRAWKADTPDTPQTSAMTGVSR